MKPRLASLAFAALPRNFYTYTRPRGTRAGDASLEVLFDENIVEQAHVSLCVSMRGERAADSHVYTYYILERRARADCTVSLRREREREHETFRARDALFIYTFAFDKESRPGGLRYRDCYRVCRLLRSLAVCEIFGGLYVFLVDWVEDVCLKMSLLL